jgi:hypothetical protein
VQRRSVASSVHANGTPQRGHVPLTACRVTFGVTFGGVVWRLWLRLGPLRRLGSITTDPRLLENPRRRDLPVHAELEAWDLPFLHRFPHGARISVEE